MADFIVLLEVNQTMKLSSRTVWSLVGICILAVAGFKIFVVDLMQRQEEQDREDQEAMFEIVRFFFENRQNADAASLSPANPPSPKNFRPIPVVSAQKVVSGFEILSVAEARGKVADEELVLALVLDEQARAYPLNVMTGPQREIFNDELAGQAIVATW